MRFLVINFRLDHLKVDFVLVTALRMRSQSADCEPIAGPNAWIVSGKDLIRGGQRPYSMGRSWQPISKHFPPRLEELGPVSSHIECLGWTEFVQPGLEHIPDRVVLTRSGYEHPFGINKPDSFVQGVIRVHLCPWVPTWDRSGGTSMALIGDNLYNDDRR